MGDLILAIDEGTTGTTVLIFDENQNVLAKGYHEFAQIFPKPGWVEHDPDVIWKTVESTIAQALEKAGVSGNRIAGIGITNQRETTVVWDRATGKPYFNAIVWQCRRTAPICQDLKNKNLEEKFRKATGLVLDPYFSGTKLTWLFENAPAYAEATKTNKAAFGTIDCFLVWRLTGGEHVTDPSNASRTLLFNINTMKWDEELCNALKVPMSVLPKVGSSSEIYGYTKGLSVLPDGIPVCGIAGDQQAALFGQTCFDQSEAKCTYGTGSFLLYNTGSEAVASHHGLLTTVGWKIGNEVVYALEGSVFIAGAAVQWIRDGLGLIKTSADIEGLAAQVEDSGGVVFVPALAGLGAPHWNPEARGVIWGITRGTTKAHIARAALEGIALAQVDIVRAMEDDSGRKLSKLKVDGGACVNNLLMQFQADVLGVPIVRPKMFETTGLGAALLAGLAIGMWKDKGEIRKRWREDRKFTPSMPQNKREEIMARWNAALSRV